MKPGGGGTKSTAHDSAIKTSTCVPKKPTRRLPQTLPLSVEHGVSSPSLYPPVRRYSVGDWSARTCLAVVNEAQHGHWKHLRSEHCRRARQMATILRWTSISKDANK